MELRRTRAWLSLQRPQAGPRRKPGRSPNNSQRRPRHQKTYYFSGYQDWIARKHRTWKQTSTHSPTHVKEAEELTHAPGSKRTQWKANPSKAERNTPRSWSHPDKNPTSLSPAPLNKKQRREEKEGNFTPRYTPHSSPLSTSQFHQIGNSLELEYGRCWSERSTLKRRRWCTPRSKPDRASHLASESRGHLTQNGPTT
jgi:hypothetical protein